MARVEGQDIPSEILDPYKTGFKVAALWLLTPWVGKRIAFKLANMQWRNAKRGKKSGGGPSAKQLAIRAAFSRCVQCYNNQPATGGATPPALGPRNRSWWFSDAIGSGLWYYDYFIQQSWQTYFDGDTPDWCKNILESDVYVNQGQPDENYSDSTLLACYEKNDIFEYVLAKNPYTNLDYINLHYSNWSAYSIEVTRTLLNVYEIDSAWTKNSVTWNLTPELGNLISSTWITKGGPWYRLYAKSSTAAVAIVQMGPAYNVVLHASEHALEEYHPFWST